MEIKDKPGVEYLPENIRLKKNIIYRINTKLHGLI